MKSQDELGHSNDENHPYFSCSEEESDDVHEHKVYNVSFKSIYTPHRISAFFIAIFWIALNYYFHFYYSTCYADNLWNGFVCLSGILLIISTLIFPNGPFIRPHPIVWRLTLGLSTIYLLLLIFCLFQSYETVRNMIFYMDPLLVYNGPDTKDYAADCSLTWKTISPQLDVFCLLHLIGWLGKTFVIRHSGLLWFFSIMWEMTEVFFQHLLANFKECWWDVLFLDILFCNGLGIVIGQYTLYKVKCKEFHWESIKKIKGAKGKIKRFILQFSPLKLDPINWLGTDSILKRVIQLTFFSIIWQTSELNTFFLKHIYIVYTKHWLNSVRCTLLVVLAVPSTRQLYELMTNPKVKTLGIYSWVFILITLVEVMLEVTHGIDLFKNTDYKMIIYWFLMQFFCSFIVLYAAVMWKNKVYNENRTKRKTK